jgi:hypothetical protein
MRRTIYRSSDQSIKGATDMRRSIGSLCFSMDMPALVVISARVVFLGGFSRIPGILPFGSLGLGEAPPAPATFALPRKSALRFEVDIEFCQQGLGDAV